MNKKLTAKQEKVLSFIGAKPFGCTTTKELSDHMNWWGDMVWCTLHRSYGLRHQEGSTEVKRYSWKESRYEIVKVKGPLSRGWLKDVTVKGITRKRKGIRTIFREMLVKDWEKSNRIYLDDYHQPPLSVDGWSALRKSCIRWVPIPEGLPIPPAVDGRKVSYWYLTPLGWLVLALHKTNAPFDNTTPSDIVRDWLEDEGRLTEVPAYPSEALIKLLPAELQIL